MQYMDRRTMLCAMALGVLVAIRRAPAAGAVRWKIPLGRLPAPAGVLTRLPGDGDQLALTVDDGASVPVVGAFAQFCVDTGTRLIFFVNGANSSWSVKRAGATTDDRLRAGCDGQPHLVAPVPQPPQSGRGGRSDPPQRRFPEDHLRR